MKSANMMQNARPNGFARSEDGSFVIFVLFVFLMILTIGGLGVDFMRYEAQRVRLQATLDRAVLAASSLEQPLPPTEVVLDYFDKAGLGSYIDASDVTVVETNTSRYVEATADMQVDSTLLKFSGIDYLTAVGTGAAEEAAAETEISLVLDVSGSMNRRSSSGYTKLAILKWAAKKFINVVLCDPTDDSETTDCVVEDGQVSVSIIPYSEQVTVGETVLQHFNVTNEHNDSHCVTFDASDFDNAGIDPDVELQRTGHFDPWNGYSSSVRSTTCEREAAREVTVLEADIPTLHEAIDDLSAHGNTSLDLGMKWGAAFLHPDLQPVIDELIDDGEVDAKFSDRPLVWSTRGAQKVVVLMTDGQNTSQHYLYDKYRSGPSDVWVNLKENGTRGTRYSVYHSGYDKYYWVNDRSWHDEPEGLSDEEECDWAWIPGTGWEWQCVVTVPGYGAEELNFAELWRVKTWSWFKRFRWLGYPGSAYGRTTKNNRLSKICGAAKDAGMIVFTVGFEVPDYIAPVMRDCASSDAHYFDVDGLDLSTAFAAIAREITQLRLVN